MRPPSVDSDNPAWAKMFGNMQNPYWSPAHPRKYSLHSGVYLPALAGYLQGSNDMDPRGCAGIFNLAWKTSGWRHPSDQPPAPEVLQNRVMWSVWNAPLLRLGGKSLVQLASALSLEAFQAELNKGYREARDWNLAGCYWSNATLVAKLLET